VSALQFWVADGSRVVEAFAAFGRGRLGGFRASLGDAAALLGKCTCDPLTRFLLAPGLAGVDSAQTLGEVFFLDAVALAVKPVPHAVVPILGKAKALLWFEEVVAVVYVLWFGAFWLLLVSNGDVGGAHALVVGDGPGAVVVADAELLAVVLVVPLAQALLVPVRALHALDGVHVPDAVARGLSGRADRLSVALVLRSVLGAIPRGVCGTIIPDVPPVVVKHVVVVEVRRAVAV